MHVSFQGTLKFHLELRLRTHGEIPLRCSSPSQREDPANIRAKLALRFTVNTLLCNSKNFQFSVQQA
jgi:hypothetical protein